MEIVLRIYPGCKGSMKVFTYYNIHVRSTSSWTLRANRSGNSQKKFPPEELLKAAIEEINTHSRVIRRIEVDIVGHWSHRRRVTGRTCRALTTHELYVQLSLIQG